MHYFLGWKHQYYYQQIFLHPFFGRESSWPFFSFFFIFFNFLFLFVLEICMYFFFVKNQHASEHREIIRKSWKNSVFRPFYQFFLFFASNYMIVSHKILKIKLFIDVHMTQNQNNLVFLMISKIIISTANSFCFFWFFFVKKCSFLHCKNNLTFQNKKADCIANSVCNDLYSFYNEYMSFTFPENSSVFCFISSIMNKK